jgi:hypothetical protein
MQAKVHNIKYNTYTLQLNDTLESIATILGEDKGAIVRFHNIYAKPHEIIGQHFPEGLAQLYIQPHFNGDALSNMPKVNFSYDAKIDIQPYNNHLQYNIKQLWYFDKTYFELRYNMQVAFIEKTESYFIFELTKKPFEPFDEDETLQLEIQVMETIYPLKVHVDNDGFYAGVANIEDILQRWQELKNLWLKTFERESIKTAIAFYNSIFVSKTHIEEKLKGDLFLNAYFGGLHVNYTKAHKVLSNLYFPTIPNINNALFEVHNYIEPYLSKENLVCIERIGVLADKRG